MNNLEVFENPEFGSVRTMEISGEPWFVGKDVAATLGYQNGSRDINRHVYKEDRKKMMVFDGNQDKETIIINESGLYSLIFSSKLPKAKEFKRWVTSEVLPAIRKTGGYVSDSEMFIETYLPFADENTKMLFKSTLYTLKEQTKMISEMKPKADFYDHVGNDKGAMTIDEAAKVLNCGTGQRRLFEFLRQEKYLMANNLPYQQYINLGWFRVIEKQYITNKKKNFNSQTLITQKGLTKIFEKLLESGKIK